MQRPSGSAPTRSSAPVFQDTILPTTAYVGGPAEVAYFAQSAVLYQRILGRITPILPRLSATLIEPAIGAMMAQHEVSLPNAMLPAEELAQRLAARALPIEAKRRLADAGNALDAALAAAQDYLAALDPSLARAAEVSASKMRYQMDRLRRLAATAEMQRDASLRKHAEAISLHLFPNAHVAGARAGRRLVPGRVGVRAQRQCRTHRAPGRRGSQPIRGPPRHPDVTRCPLCVVRSSF